MKNELEPDAVAAMASSRLADVQRQCRDGVRATQAKKKPTVIPENPFKRPPKVVQDELPSIKPARKEVAQLLAGHTEHEKKAQAVLARRQKLYEDAISVTSQEK